MGKGNTPRIFRFFVAFLAVAVLVPGLAAGAMRGDLDGDGQVCRTDLNIILSHRNQPADVCPECDLDGDGMITALDARKLVLLCTCPRCVSVRGASCHNSKVYGGAEF